LRSEVNLILGHEGPFETRASGVRARSLRPQS
jgi:hypothetical protein